MRHDIALRGDAAEEVRTALGVEVDGEAAPTAERVHVRRATSPCVRLDADHLRPQVVEVPCGVWQRGRLLHRQHAHTFEGSSGHVPSALQALCAPRRHRGVSAL